MLFFSDNFFPVESDIVIWSLSLCPADWAVRGFTDGVLVLGGGGGGELGMSHLLLMESYSCG